MTMRSLISNFLESSTIHGLAHISTAKSTAARLAWVTIVVACFAIAISMITNSYKEWQESPVSTTITTHPISELQFPAVTVCPPRGSNTALNQALERVKHVDFTERERQKLINISREIFVELPSKNYARQMSELLSPENIRSIADNGMSIPHFDRYTNTTTLTSRELQGSFSTPGFGNSEYKRDFYDRSHSLHYELIFPENISEILGEDSLVISVETEDDWSYRWHRMTFYKDKLNMTDAEELCVSKGQHLASLTSKEMEDQLFSLLPPYGYDGGKDTSPVWIGGQKKTQGWQWLDEELWRYEGIWDTFSDRQNGWKCLSVQPKGRWRSGLDWRDRECSEKHKFVCLDSVIETQQNMTFRMTRESMTAMGIHILWKHAPLQNFKGLPGIQVQWKIDNRNETDRVEFVSRELSGSVSTGQLGSLPSAKVENEIEYTAVIDLPHNITKVLVGHALVVDIDFIAAEHNTVVELWTTDFNDRYGLN